MKKQRIKGEDADSIKGSRSEYSLVDVDKTPMRMHVYPVRDTGPSVKMASASGFAPIIGEPHPYV